MAGQDDWLPISDDKSENSSVEFIQAGCGCKTNTIIGLNIGSASLYPIAAVFYLLFGGRPMLIADFGILLMSLALSALFLCLDVQSGALISKGLMTKPIALISIFIRIFQLIITLGFFVGLLFLTGDMYWHSLVNTGVNGCYDSCGVGVFIFALYVIIDLIIGLSLVAQLFACARLELVYRKLSLLTSQGV